MHSCPPPPPHPPTPSALLPALSPLPFCLTSHFVSVLLGPFRACAPFSFYTHLCIIVHSFIHLFFIFRLLAVLSVRLTAPRRANLVRFTPFIIPASPVFLASLPPVQFLPYFTAKMFPLSHFQHLTEHTWKLFMPFNLSSLLFPSLTSQYALIFSLKYASRVACLSDTAKP